MSDRVGGLQLFPHLDETVLFIVQLLLYLFQVFEVTVDLFIAVLATVECPPLIAGHVLEFLLLAVYLWDLLSSDDGLDLVIVEE